MPLFRGNVKVVSMYPVEVEAKDEYEAAMMIDGMVPSDLLYKKPRWTEVDTGDEMPEEV